MQKIAKNLPSGHHRTNLSGCIFTTEAFIDNRKKHVKQRYLLHISQQYGELRPSNGWHRFISWGHPSKFQRVSLVGFVTTATSLSGGQPNFARCLAISWASTLYIHYLGHLPRAEFCQVQNSLYVEVLRSPMLAALLHGTPAAGVSQTLRRGTWNGITELSQRDHLYLAGRPSRWASAHILVLFVFR